MEILDSYGWWVVVSKTVDNGRVLCRCRCGQEKRVALNNLRRGLSLSCGCRKPEATRLAKTTHGWSHTGLYRCWANMLYRCESPNATDYKHYGGDGIRVCEEWHDFEIFKIWALQIGYDETLTLDRIDNDGDYEPNNCQWVPLSQNLRNTSRAIYLTAWGKTKHLAEWVEDHRCTVSYSVLKMRVRSLGWEHERAISTPLLTKGGKPR